MIHFQQLESTWLEQGGLADPFGGMGRRRALGSDRPSHLAPTGQHLFPQRAKLPVWRRIGPPHHLQLLGLVARHNMHMGVEHALPGRRPRRMHRVHPCRGQRDPQQPRDPAARPRHLRVLVVVQVLQPIGVMARNHWRMPDRRRGDVQIRDRVLVLQQPMRRNPAGHDLTEDTVTHRRSLCQPTGGLGRSGDGVDCGGWP
jgi:hypothetical protein